jgi:hypothetical protein
MFSRATSGGQESTFTLSAVSATSIVSQSYNRRALIFSNNGGQAVRISLDPVVTNNRGILLAVNSVPVMLTYRDVGGIVNQQWFAITAGVGGTICVEECLDPEALNLLHEFANGHSKIGQRSFQVNRHNGHAPNWGKPAKGWLDNLAPEREPIFNSVQRPSGRIRSGDDILSEYNAPAVRIRLRVNDQG